MYLHQYFFLFFLMKSLLFMTGRQHLKQSKKIFFHRLVSKYIGLDKLSFFIGVNIRFVILFWSSTLKTFRKLFSFTELCQKVFFRTKKILKCFSESLHENLAWRCTFHFLFLFSFFSATLCRLCFSIVSYSCIVFWLAGCLLLSML